MRKKKKLNTNEVKKKYEESAGNIRRLIAYGIDWYMTSLLVMIPVALLYSIETGEKALTIDISILSYTHMLLAFCIGFILCCWYLIYLPLKTGQTIGKRVTEIKIIRLDHKELDIRTLVKREIVGAILIEGVMFTISTYFHQIVAEILHITYSHYIAYGFMVLLVVSIIIAIIKPEKRMIHDYIASTKVISMK